MKSLFILLLSNIVLAPLLFSQNGLPDETQSKALKQLIDKYSQARETRDTALLATILTNDIDQLVSTGEWRYGMDAAMKGMMNSSATSPGTRTLTVEKIKMLNSNNAIVDCRYEIQNANGITRKMWSTFIVLFDKGVWKISAIRNMLPGTP